MTEDIHDLVELYVLHALPLDEHDAFELHLPSCEQCLAAVEQLTTLVGQLDDAHPMEPPPQLKQSVMSAIAETPQAEPVNSAQSTHPTPAPVAEVIDLTTERSARRGPRILVAAAAACVLVVGLVVAVAQTQSERTFEDLASVPDAETIVLDGESTADVQVAWSDDANEFVIEASGLDELTDDLTYQLWLFEGEAPISAGTFRPDIDGNVTFQADLVGDPAIWAITVEASGGVDAPTSDPIFVAVL